MLPKAHLTSHSRISGSRWVITSLWLSGSWRSFLYGSSVYSCYLFLISSVSVRSIPFLTFHLCMKCSLGISNFLEAISSLSHSVVFLYFFALITKEGFLVPLCYSLEFCTQVDISFLSPLPFTSLLFSAICKAFWDNHFAFVHFFFLVMVLIIASCTMSQASVHSSSGTVYQFQSLDSSCHFPWFEILEWNNAICSYMHRPRNYHTKWSKTDRQRQISCDITYM